MEVRKSLNLVLVTADRTQTAPLVAVLTMLGHDVHTMQHGERATLPLCAKQADVMIVDWQLPVVTAVGWLQWLRARYGRRATLVFWTRQFLDASLRLDAVAENSAPGPNPEAMRELVTTVNALLNSMSASTEPVSNLRVGRYEISSGLRRITLDGEVIALTATEFDLAELLFRNHGKALHRKIIWGVLRGETREFVSRALDTHMYHLRAKLALSERNGVTLTTVYRHGYRMDVVDRRQKALQPMAATAPAQDLA